MLFTTKRPALSLTADEKRRLESLRRSRSGEKRETLHPQRFEFVFTPKHGSWLNTLSKAY